VAFSPITSNSAQANYGVFCGYEPQWFGITVWSRAFPMFIAPMLLVVLSQQCAQQFKRGCSSTMLAGLSGGSEGGW
jgi:hypothetical protein